MRPYSIYSLENATPLSSIQSWKCDPIQRHIPTSLLWGSTSCLGPPVPIPGTLRLSSSCRHEKLSGILQIPIRYVSLHLRDRRGAALLRTVSEIALKSSFYVWTEAVSNNNTTSPTTLRSKRFQSSYCAKGRAGAKSKWKDEGEGEKETFSPLPSPVISFFRVRTGHGKPTTTTTTKLY